MNKEIEQYIHGYSAKEQERLGTLNLLLNERCRKAFTIEENSKVLDVGAGLGILSRQIARETNSEVIGVEKSEDQIAQFQKLAEKDNETNLVELRTGSAYELPLKPAEWGTFDVAYTRFLLEHVSRPQQVVDQMAQSIRPGGQVILIDDDHLHFQCYPPVPLFNEVWTLYLQSYDRNGHDAFIGRKLVYMLKKSGLKILTNDFVNFGSHIDDPAFPLFVDNIKEIIRQTESQIVDSGRLPRDVFERAMEALEQFKNTEGAAIWYSMHLAIGLKV